MQPRLTQALVEYFVQRRSENQQVIQNWVERQPGLSAVASLAKIFSAAPTPINPTFVSKSVFASYQEFLNQGSLGSSLSRT